MKSGDLSVIKSVYKFSSSHYDEHINSITNGTKTSDLISDKMFDNTNGNIECSSRMNGILEEFTKLYAEKLHRLDDVTGEEDLKKKVSVLESWVNDLGEQNSILVTTVEELEKEASRRVFLLQEKLDKMAIVTRDSCVSLRDHQLQVTTLIKQKISAEDDAKTLQEKILHLGETNNSLLQENSHLRQDLHNILEVMSRGRQTGRWDYSDFDFHLIQPDQLSIPEQSKVQGKISLRSFEPLDNQCRHDSLTSSLSLDGDESVAKLEEEIHNLKKTQSETHIIITQRDKHIAELQAQLTELYHRFSAAQTQVDNTTSTLQSLLDRGRQDSFEIFRRDEVIRQLLSPLRRYKAENASVDEEETKTKLDVEYQLSNNIDLLTNRLIDLEEECQQLRHQNAALKNSHAHDHANPHALTHAHAPHLKEKESFAKLSNNVSSSSERHQKDASDKEPKQISRQIQTDEKFASTSNIHDRDVEKSLSADIIRISKLENELSEKNILVRELQNHLVLSREELRLKDETLYNVEQKLDCCRRNYDEKEERMLYLTSQLTNLQLEVSRLHGNLQQLRMQLDNKSKLVLKLEFENRSLVRQLNEKSSVHEGIQRDFSHLIADIERKKKEVAEQKLAIGTLQDALVAAKVNYDRLKSQFGSQSASYLPFNISRPLVLPSGRMESIPSKEPASQMSTTLPDIRILTNTTLPDIRALNTDDPPLHRNCPDVVSFSSSETDPVAEKYFQTKLSTENRFPSLKTLNLIEKSSQNEPQSLPPGSVETLTFNPSDSFQSLSNFTTDYKSLLAQSPTDSGIGSDEFGNEKEHYSETNFKKSGSIGKVFEI